MKTARPAQPANESLERVGSASPAAWRFGRRGQECCGSFPARGIYANSPACPNERRLQAFASSHARDHQFAYRV
eukprot:scaffold4581_cov63-Phaeocystis_antarctica.AAC.2